MKYSGIEWDNIYNGEGVRAVLFVSGCNHKCKGCHNPDTWSFDNGEEFTLKEQTKIIEYCKQPYVSGITLSGGDPLFSINGLLFFIKKFGEECPDKDIWIYSGFTYEEIMKDKKMKSFLTLCDVLVDGRYEDDNKDVTLSFKGSYNQRIINIKASTPKSIVNWKHTFL